IYTIIPVPIVVTLANSQPNQSIGIIGTGLSALDVVKYLLKQHNWTHPIRLYTDGNTPFKTVKFSRYQGQIQQSFSDEWIDSHRNQDGFISLEVMVETFLNDLKANDIDIQRLLELYEIGRAHV